MVSKIMLYGTLMQHDHTSMHDMMRQKLKFISPCKARGSLYDMGRYPAFRETGDAIVVGELYEIIDDSILGELDEYEAHDNKDPEKLGFKRKLVELLGSDESAWIYEYNGPVPSSVRIESGSWAAK